MESKEKERNREGKKERTFLFPLKLGHRRKKTFLYLSFCIPLSSISFSNFWVYIFRNCLGRGTWEAPNTLYLNHTILTFLGFFWVRE